MRIGECRTHRAGQHHGAVDHGSGAQVGKAIEPLGRSVATQSGWMEPEKFTANRQSVARHLREKIPPQHAGCDDQRKRRERDVQCGAEGVVESLSYQTEERGVAFFVSNKESTVWRKTSVKTLIREKQLKYTDVDPKIRLEKDAQLPWC